MDGRDWIKRNWIARKIRDWMTTFSSELSLSNRDRDDASHMHLKIYKNAFKIPASRVQSLPYQ